MITLKTILVPTDFSECSDEAVRYGLELARRFDANVHLLHVVHDPATQAWAGDGFSVPLLEVVEQWQRDSLERLQTAVPVTDEARVTVQAIVGSPALEILRYASAHAVDLIVMGTHGRGGVSHMLVGSIAEKMVRRAPCPVLTVRHPQHGFVEADALVAVTASAT
jgi:nucleotide-binding universal stress UspA family protein